MPVLVPGVAVRSRRPTLLVENDLAVGSWRFRLTVVDDAGLESRPADLVVRVVGLPRAGPGGGSERGSAPPRTGGGGRRRSRAAAAETVRPPKPDGAARPAGRP